MPFIIVGGIEAPAIWVLARSASYITSNTAFSHFLFSSFAVHVGYDPPANSADHLIYLAADDHDIETRVRGLHGQHSDLGIARKNKRIARNRDPKRRRVKIKSKGFQKGPKRKIQSRGFR
jgi:hypothetical protein